MLAWLRFFVVVICVVLAAGPGQAAWRVAEGIDIGSGGASTLLIGELDERTSLYARCVAGTAEFFVDSFVGSDVAPAPVGKVILIVTTDVGRTWSSPARYAREKSGYLTTTWLSGGTIGSVVADIAAAKAAISISIEFEEVGATTWDTDAKGSTAAARKFLEACPPSAGVTPAAPPSMTPAT